MKVEVQADGKGTIVSVDERVNELIRPPVANIDQAIIVNSLAEPDFSPLLLDRFLVLIEHKENQTANHINENRLSQRVETGIN